MNEQHVGSQLSAYLDNELDAENKQVVESHLFSCERCLKSYEDLLFVKDQLRMAYTDTEAPDSLEDTIMAAIWPESRPLHSRNKSMPFLASAFIIAAIALIAIAFMPLLASWVNFMSAFFTISFSMAHAATVIINKLPAVMSVIIAMLILIILGSVWTIIKLLPVRSLFEEESNPSTR